MNIFDNIANQFTGNTQKLPSFTPQAPRTSSYVAPNVPYTTVQQPQAQVTQQPVQNDATMQLKQKYGYNDKDIEFLKQAKQKGIDSKRAFEFLNKKKEQEKQGEDLGFFGGAKELLVGGFRSGEQIPRLAGAGMDYLTQNVTGPLVAGGLDLVGADQLANRYREATKTSGEAFKRIGEDITMAGMTDGGTNPLTQKQIEMRQLGGELALTAPIGGGYIAGAKTIPSLALRSGVVGAGFGAVQPIADKGADATLSDIGYGGLAGGVTGTVAGPVLSKIVAPAIGGVASKTLKYGKAGYRGGLTGMGKSIARDTKAGIQAITPSGANISTRANRFNANEIREFTKITGQSPGDFATSRGMTKVGDDAVVEATNLWQKSKEQADEALQAIKGRFRFTDEGEDLLKTTIDDLETRLVNTKSPDSKRISQLKAKYEDSGLTMSEINEIKRAYSNNYKYSFVDAGSESALRSKNLQDAVRKWQFKVAEENGLTNLKDINKTTQGWKMFADSLSKKIQGSSGNNNVSLTDWIALSGGGPENIALYLGKKLASSDKIKSGAIKLFSKKTKPSIIQASKADIQQANFKKDVNRGVSGVGDRSGGKSLVKPVGLIEAPKGKATGATYFRVNQPMEKSPIKNEGQVGKRPGTKAVIKTPESVQLAKQAQRQKQVKEVERDLNTALLSNYNPNKPQATKDFIERNITQGKITREEAIEMVEHIYEKANGFDKPHYEKILNDLYSNKKIESFDDILNEKQVKTIVKTPKQEFSETPEGIYREINKKANDRRYNPEKANALIAKFKEKTGIDLMKNPMQKFDEKGNVIKSKPLIKSNESKVNKPISGDTIPEGYFKNAFGEIVKKPNSKKAGFIKNPFAKPIVKRANDVEGSVIGEGSDRKVIDIGGNKVKKIPKNYRGLIQMDVDYKKLSDEGLIPNVIEKGDGYVIFEKVKTGGKLIDDMISEIKSLKGNKPEILKTLNKYGYNIKSLDGIPVNEILNPNNWGVKNGKAIIIDEGVFADDKLFGMGKNISEIDSRIKYVKNKEKEFKQIYEQANSPKPIVKRSADVESGLIEEARKYRNVEEFKALGFEKILEDLRGVKNDSIVEIPTKDIKIVWKQDLENAKEFAKKTYNINEAPPVDFTYDIKTGKYILEDGHHRYISALRNKSNLKGKIDGIKGNMEELANLYEKEKLVSIKQIYEQANKSIPVKNPLVEEARKIIEPKNFKIREEQYNKELWDFVDGKSKKTEQQIKAEYKDVSDYITNKADFEKKAVQKSIQGLPNNSTDIGENIYYHGTSAEFPKFNRPKVLHGDIFGEGIYLTPNKYGAELYAKQAVYKGGEPKIAVVKVKGKIKEIDGSNDINTPGYTKNAVQKARKEGYDGVKIKHNVLDKGGIRGEDIIMIFDPENAIIQRFASKPKKLSK